VRAAVCLYLPGETGCQDVTLQELPSAVIKQDQKIAAFGSSYTIRIPNKRPRNCEAFYLGLNRFNWLASSLGTVRT
ncbi:hypothetical protein SOP89_23825, partial [Pseudomonas siliginis]|uniref:hypothetical protein n=1 Tax=Pseudomonas siliginis TaxID=2842346 RepID=UPI002B255052